MPSLRAVAVRTMFAAGVTAQRALRERQHGPISPDDPDERFEELALEIRTALEQVTQAVLPVAGIERSDADGAPVPSWWLAPERDTEGRVVLYLHGGAYIAGSRATHRGLASALARTARARVLLPEYRLAPEHRFPAAVDDAVACYRWLVEDEGVDPAAIVIAGDSAGGGLAFGTALALRDEGLPLPAGVVGMSPWTDLTATGETIRTHTALDPWLDGEFIAPTARIYAREALEHPYASPIFGDFTGLPPMLVHVGEREVLLDDARRLVAVARRDGVDASLGVFDGMWHVFQAVPMLPEAHRSLRELGGFVRRVTDARTRPTFGGLAA